LSRPVLARKAEAAPSKTTAQIATGGLRVGAPDDAYEREADRVADEVMAVRSAAPKWSFSKMNVWPGVQRKCDCGGSAPGAGECEECKKKGELQRAPADAVGLNWHAPRIVDEVLNSSGAPIDRTTLRQMEARFGQQFGDVRIHTDARAADSARAVHALAYTVGRNIVFGPERYTPDSYEGRKLLAHELAHVVQQSEMGVVRTPRPIAPQTGPRSAALEPQSRKVTDGWSSAAPEGAGVRPFAARPLTPINKTLQRMASAQMPLIRKDLTYGIFDWAVTDAEAHEVLEILKRLPEADLADTVAAMEKDGLVQRLFENVSDADQFAYADTVQRIQNLRVHAAKTGPSTVGSCSPKELKTAEDKIDAIKDLARQAKNSVNDFISEPDKHPNTATLLDKNFFHNSRNPPGLVPAQQKLKAQQIATNLESVEKQVNPFPIQCASPIDIECTTIAAAYVSDRDRVVRLCQVYFGYSSSLQTLMLFHEFVHAYAGVDDHGYGGDRVFAYLTPDDAIDNADSYTMFSADITGKGGGASAYRPAATADSITDCTDDQAKILRRAFAFGSRMIFRALQGLSDTSQESKSLRESWTSKHFGTTDSKDIIKIKERFQKLESAFEKSVNFQCEKQCNPKGIGYYIKIFGHTAHVCPDYFLETSDIGRINLLLEIVIAERLGIKAYNQLNNSGANRQTFDQAYDNATSYVGYASDVTQKWGT
jgi:Domain of unknown function (DUF4157)/Lysine-specific metallo-endopeptidase